MVGRLSDIHNQADLVNLLTTLRMAAVYDLFGQTLLHNFYKDIAAGNADASTLIATLPEGNITLKQFTDQLNGLSNHALVETKRNSNRALTRNLFKESFRITEAYCRKSSQHNALKAEDWFEFARVVANSLSHNFRFEFRRFDHSRLPVSYNEVTVDASFDGQPISMKLEILIKLADELIAFARTIH